MSDKPLAYVSLVKSLEPIEGKDRIELAKFEEPCMAGHRSEGAVCAWRQGGVHRNWSRASNQGGVQVS